MYVNHPSLTQSVHWISFSAVLHRACDWFTGTFSLKLEWHTMLVCVEAHTHTSTHAHTHICTYRLLICYCTGFPLPGGESWWPCCQRRPLWDFLKVAMSSWLCQHLFRMASRLAWERPVYAAWPWLGGRGFGKKMTVTADRLQRGWCIHVV